ncbi:DUF3761 domain-containing protein [Dokdonella ginsengisoli]|uniref:DUF3761 domain-containing protein n=1 Tax=Dokdonella ginsengisoli TaxID=363846 RepID=A0ABV9QQG8_9GAMM
MNVFPAVFALPLALLFAAGAHAQAPTGAPAGTTGLCKDGSYTSAEAKRGACRGHQGVKDWYAANAAPAAKSDGAGAGARASSSAVPAATPAAAPSGSTGLCKDGSYTDADSRKGACRGHKGVKEWYGASVAAAARPAAPPVPPPAAAPSMPAAPPATAAPQPTTAPPSVRKPAEADPADRAAAPGGGAGKVWVNLETKVYHCPSDRYYGKTKQGEYLSEAEAKAKGNHAAHGKACTP